MYTSVQECILLLLASSLPYIKYVRQRRKARAEEEEELDVLLELAVMPLA